MWALLGVLHPQNPYNPEGAYLLAVFDTPEQAEEYEVRSRRMYPKGPESIYYPVSLLNPFSTAQIVPLESLIEVELWPHYGLKTDLPFNPILKKTGEPPPMQYYQLPDYLAPATPEPIQRQPVPLEASSYLAPPQPPPYSEDDPLLTELAEQLENLSYRARAILLRRVHDKIPFREIGSAFYVGVERARQIYTKALHQIAQEVNISPDDVIELIELYGFDQEWIPRTED